MNGLMRAVERKVFQVVTDGAETVILRSCLLAMQSECVFTNLGWHRRISCPGIWGSFLFFGGFYDQIIYKTMAFLPLIFYKNECAVA